MTIEDIGKLSVRESWEYLCKIKRCLTFLVCLFNLGCFYSQKFVYLEVKYYVRVYPLRNTKQCVWLPSMTCYL